MLIILIGSIVAILYAFIRKSGKKGAR
ncbi:phosphoribosylamine--glycine ligase [Bacillus sp. NRRL B-14911]|nr:phosphoribosylamine--glycine ligase [Bacillus sp. NRRL B-14911]